MFADYANHHRSCLRYYYSIMPKRITWLLAHKINTNKCIFSIQWLLLPQMRHKQTQVNAKLFLIQISACIYSKFVRSFVCLLIFSFRLCIFHCCFKGWKSTQRLKTIIFFALVTFFVLNHARIENNNSFETPASSFELIAKVVLMFCRSFC